MLTIIYTTINSLTEAEKLAAQAIITNLAACVNIIPQITSFYKWENKLTKSSEYILLFKTASINKQALINWLENNHPYEVPAIIACAADCSANFLKFLTENSHV